MTPLTFHKVNTSLADILIGFEPNEHGDGFPFGSQFAHAFYPYGDGHYGIDGDIHFADKYNWTTKEVAPYPGNCTASLSQPPNFYSFLT